MLKLDYVIDICVLAARIERDIKKPIDYGSLEDEIGYSYSHIRYFFKNVANVPLARYVLVRKVAHAAFELRHTKKPVSGIAAEYGFENLETFTRAFRRVTGLAPTGFRKSGLLCGRRIICPGVYAPVILNHESMFTLQHLKEVNEMGEMKKTADSCVLYGVPKVYKWREVGGQKQCTPFPMCLQSVLNYMGQNISYTELMAYTGAAFSQRWCKDGWDISAIDIRYLYEDPLKPFELGFGGAGRKVVISVNSEFVKSIVKEDAFALIKSELDCGRPVIALGVVGPPEASIVTGYRNNGETLMGWSLFQEDKQWNKKGCEFDETGYFIKSDWWGNTNTVMAVGEEIGTKTSDIDVLKNALWLLTTESVAAYGDEGSFYGGQKAYEAWATALCDHVTFTKDTGWNAMCHGDQLRMLEEWRFYAAEYMKLMAEKYPDSADAFNGCARLFKAAADCAKPIHQLWTDHGIDGNDIREQMAAHVRQAAKHEKEAAEVLKNIIDDFGGR